MQLQVLSFRKACWAGAIFCLFLLAMGYVIEYFFHVRPCALCIFQRIVFGGILLFFVIAAIHHPKRIGQNSYLLVIALLNIIGIGLASRQLWLQSLPPDQVPSCTAGLNRLLEIYSPFEAFKNVILSSGECGQVSFTLLGLSIAAWSLISFIIIMLLCIFTWVNRRER